MKARSKGNKWDNKYPMWFPLPCWKDFHFLDIVVEESLEEVYVWNASSKLS